MGKFERATNYLKQASRLDPGFAFTWYRLSLDRNFQPTDAQLEMLEQQLANKTTPVHNDDQLVALEFSLARFQEQRGNHATAFRHFQQGNNLKAAKNHFDRPNHESQIDNVIDTFDADFFNQRQDWGSQSTLPVFIIGMPRSGTSLVEQILSAHPLMHGAGELRLMLELASSLKQDSTAPTNSHAQRVAALNRQQVDELAQQQLETIRNLQPLARHVIDKLPGNYFRLGLIRLLFPRAIIIHCHRDPMDTCWSCYQQNFDQGLNFTNDLETLGHAYRGYQRLMAHWHEVLPGQIHDIGYEELVQNPEFVSRKLLQHCGVEWHPGVLDYQQQRPDTTASMWQVRQPVYQTSIGRWKTYRQYLHPLSHVLASTDQPSPAGD